MAGGVHQASIVRCARSPVVGQIFGGDGAFDDAQPPSFPLVRRLRGLIGGEQMVRAQRAATVLPGEQAQVVAVQCGWDLASPRDPVAGQFRVVG